jgi:AmiR/NasT family two-component response regulator
VPGRPRQHRHGTLTRHLETALASRAVIDQAIGIIMGQNRCTAAALEILRRASHHRNIKLRAITYEIITRIGGEPPDPSATFAAEPDGPS